MELLAPAGNYDAAAAAIRNGCDAIFGGLKEWSARNRAINFDRDAYEKTLKLCHDNNVKFYLTLNTLLHDDELEKIEALFDGGEFGRPDAVIAADIGLIHLFLEKYPHIPVHASTQFGAASLEDVLFLQELGVERVILARELTLSEIKYIKDNSSVELEVFVYGAQCVLFSGFCLWGGLINGCSGNRGRCTMMCNDIYETKGKEGRFLSAKEMNALAYIKKLEEMGISSVKIEGRLRSPEEIGRIVQEYRSVMQGDFWKKVEYSSYLEDRMPAGEMFSDAYNIVRKVMLSNGLDVNGLNIRITVVWDKDTLTALDVIDTFGVRHSYQMAPGQKAEIRAGELYHLLATNVQVKIYEIISRIPEDSIVKMNLTEVKDIIGKINQEYEGHQRTVDRKNMTVSWNGDISNHIVEIDNIRDFKRVYERGGRKFIYQIKKKKDFYEMLSLETDYEDAVVYYKLPQMMFSSFWKEMLLHLENRNVVFSKISQLFYLKQFRFGTVMMDYSVNVWNKRAMDFLESYGINEFTYSPELSIENTEKVFQGHSLNNNMIVFAKMPIGYTRACMRGTGFCNETCGDSEIIYRNKSKGYPLKFCCDNEFGYRTLYYDIPIVAESGGIHATKRFVLVGLREEEKVNLLLGKELCHGTFKEGYIGVS